MDYSFIPVESVQERDIDLLIIEELNVSLDFAVWLLNELDLKQPPSQVKAYRSVSDFGLGETDILISYLIESSTNFILVENKIDASFQQSQFERYRKRAENYVKNKECDKCHVVLMAPKSYCKSQTDFSSFVTYENIKKYFINQNNTRGNYKAEILSIAIEKERRGYVAMNSIPVQAFWKAYYKYQNINHNRFRMKKPDIVPFKSDWIQLQSERLKEITFNHKLEKGFIDANVKIIPNLKSELPDWIEIIEHKKSVSFRVKCTEIDRTKSLNIQVKEVEESFEKLTKLEHWLSNETSASNGT